MLLHTITSGLQFFGKQHSTGIPNRPAASDLIDEPPAFYCT